MLNLKIDNTDIFLILQLLRILQNDKFPIKIAFTMANSKAERQTVKSVGLRVIQHLFFQWPALCGIFFFSEFRHSTVSLWELKVID